jgi:hypothetical protein
MRYDAEATSLSTADSKEKLLDILVDLRLLSQCGRPWTHLFIVEGEVGEQIYQQFREVALGNYGLNWIQTLVLQPRRVPGGIVMHRLLKVPPIEPSEPQHYVQICVYDNFLVFGPKAKSLLILACFLLDLDSLTETRPSGGGGGGPVIHLVVAPGNFLGETGV